MSDTVIQVKGLKKYFGDVKAVDNISFEVEQGELFGFLGMNGAGKSTTINMLCTVLPPTKGEIMVCGLRAGRENEQIRKQIGVVYQDHCLDGLLTVKENLFTRGALYEKNSKKLRENISKICQILELTEVYGRRVGKLSGGQKRRCEIARALVNTPKVMFLDEPTTGLDPATRKKVWQCLDRLRREEKMTIFLTTHYMEEAAKASHIAIIDGGILREYGTPFSLKETYAKDQLKLIPRQETADHLIRYFAEKKAGVKKREEFLIVDLPESMAALPILNEIKGWINGFEVVQGSMDDVFLNVTGKKLAQA